MLLLAGTVPFATGVYQGRARLIDRELAVGQARFAVERGTAAMAASAVQVCAFYGLDAPYCIFGGDIADGKGTDMMFRSLIEALDELHIAWIVLHYLFPKISYGRMFAEKFQALDKRPALIADAGGMYLMKSINRAYLCDVFTPDQGELYFLADEYAPHPLYVRSELLAKSITVETLVASAYGSKNTARTTNVKGAVDHVYREGDVIAQVAEPDIPAMEAVGGTGDTITGMLAALRYKNDPDADSKALRLNRLIGKKISCRAWTQIGDFIQAIPEVLRGYE